MHDAPSPQNDKEERRGQYLRLQESQSVLFEDGVDLPQLPL